MKKCLHDRLSSATMKLINYDALSSDEDQMHPTRTEVHVDSFAKAGKMSKQRALLECERRFFDNKSEITFAEANSDFFMNLINRERALIFLDKRVCCSKSVFKNVNDWKDCLNELGYYHVYYCTQTKACEREKERKSDENEEDDNAETDEDVHSEIETEAEDRFGYTRTVPDSCVAKKKIIQSTQRNKLMT